MAQPVTAVRDWLGKESPLQATISYDVEVNGNQSISATILPSEVNRRFIADITEMWMVIDHFGVEQKIVYLQRRGQGEEQSVQIKGIPLFFDVMNSDRIYERVDKHMTAMEAFTRIFENTGFTFVLADSFDAVEWEGFGEGETRLESFKRALDRYGAEFYIRGKQVTLKKLIGRDLQTMYAHRLNASNITLEHDASALWTYAKGFGDYGDGEGSEDWQDAKLVREYTSPLAKIIGIRHAPPLKNGNITTVATMDEQLKTLVDESLKISVTADIHDLRKQGYPIGQPEVGDRVYLVDERIGFNEQVRVVDMKLVLDWRGDVRDINLTFGTPGLSRRYQARVSSAMGAITDLLDGKIKLPPSSVYDDAMRNAVTAIQNAETELTFPTQGGIIAVDKNNPNKQVWLNSAGIMVSVDAGATAKAAITGDGVVTEMLTAGTINANRITIHGGEGLNYSLIDGPIIESRGQFVRTWQGVTEMHDVSLTFRNGYFRASNVEADRNLYYSDFGISTYASGNQDESSGTIEFFSYDYHPTRKGITISSVGGVVALRSSLERVVIDAYDHAYIKSNQQQVRIQPRNHVAGNNTFAMHVVDNADPSLQDGILYYGSENNPAWSSGLRFRKQLGSGLLSITDGTGGWGTGSLEVYDIKVNNRLTGNIEAPVDNAHAYVNNAFKVMNKAGTALRNLEVQDAIMRDVIFNSLRTGDVNSNTYIGVGSHELRVTNNQFYNDGNTAYRDVRASAFNQASSRDYKTGIVPLEDVGLGIVNSLKIVEYELIDDGDTGGVKERHIGLIAEDNYPVATADGKAINTYALTSFNTKSIQELATWAEKLEKRIEQLEGATK